MILCSLISLVGWIPGLGKCDLNGEVAVIPGLTSYSYIWESFGSEQGGPLKKYTDNRTGGVTVNRGSFSSGWSDILELSLV